MSTESSAVSDLIRLTKTQRMQTDPADAVLFRSSASSSRTAHSWEPPPVTTVTSTSTKTRPAYPSAPAAKRAWPVVLSMLVAGGLGIAIAGYYDITDETARSSAVIQMPTLPPPPPAASPAVAEPPVPVAAPPVAEPTPAAAPTITEPAPAPVPEMKHATKRGAKKHAKARPVAAPAPAPVPIAPAPAPIAPPPAAKPKASKQADDNENPLH